MDVEELKEILRVLDERKITEFELEKEGFRLRVRKAVLPAGETAGGPTVAPAGPPRGAELAPASPGAAPQAMTSGSPEAADGLAIIKSPIVGTFYRAPAPNAAPFVSVGDHVRVGQVLCVVEAMKLMNEIEAEIAGEIVRIHIENAQPVQYGEPLFSLRPE